MPPRTRQRHRKNLVERIADLEKQWAATSAEITRTLNPGDKVRLQLKADALDAEITALESELDRLDADVQMPAPRGPIWQEHLPEINFHDALGLFNTIDDELNRRDGGAATFLVHDSYQMGGKHCLSRLKKRFKTLDRPPYVIEFSAGKRPDGATFLRELGRYLGYDPQFNRDLPAGTLVPQTQEIIRQLLGSVHCGSVVLLELHIRSHVGLHDSFLPWFLDDFWYPLTDAVPRLTADYPMVKFFALIMVDHALTDLPTHLCCRHDQFDGRKLLELPLHPWTSREIRQWLFQFVGPFATGRTRNDMDALAQYIYDISNGRPSDVEKLLHDHLPQLFTEQTHP